MKTVDPGTSRTELALAPKPRQHSFYKALTVVSCGLLLMGVQMTLKHAPAIGGGDGDKSGVPLTHSNDHAAKYLHREAALSKGLVGDKTHAGRKLMQASGDDDNCPENVTSACPEYCKGGKLGQPYDPICPCDPTVDDGCLCPITEEIVFDDPPCGWDVICQNIRFFNTSDLKCQFTKTSSYCAILEGFVNYNQFVYCTFQDQIGISMTILLVWWVFLFVSLAVCADDFFCTALVVIVKTLDLSPNVAGVTFLAFGNGAPDLFSAIAAFLAMKAGDAGLAIGGLFGAGIFVTTIIVGTVAIVKPFKVTERPFLRDDIFYLLGSYYMFFIIWRERIYLYDAFLFVFIYVVYVLVVIFSGSINKRMQADIPQGAGKGAIHVASPTPGLEGTSMVGFKVEEFPTSPSGYSLDAYTAKPVNGNVYDNAGFDNDEAKANGDVKTDADQQNGDMRALAKKINEEIDAERSQGDFRKGTLTGGDLEAEVSEYEFVKLPAWKQFLMGINPINMDEWPNMPWYLKAYEIFKSPIMFFLTLTVPCVNYEIQPTHNWNRYLQCFQCLVAPMWCAFLIGNGRNPLGDSNIGLWLPLLCVGAVFAVVVFFTTEDYKIPKYHEAFGYFAFVVAMIWIYAIATEIVNLLTAFGVVLQLSNGILGLTLLAWGNSVGDFVADMVMAKQGFPRMAFSACFGAPIFHLCLGTGLPFIARMLADGTSDMKINLDTMLLLGNMTVIISMIFSLITLLFTKFRANRFYGTCLVVFYIGFVVLVIMIETGVIPQTLPSHSY